MKTPYLIHPMAGVLVTLAISISSLSALPAQAQKPGKELSATVAATATKRHYDLGSVRGLSAFLAEKKRENAKKEGPGAEQKKGRRDNHYGRKIPLKDFKSKGEVEGTGIYEEILGRLKERAFPNDRMDIGAIARGIAQRDQMAPAVLSTATTLNAFSNAGVSRGWQFIGPKGLSVPYTPYYGPINSALTGRVSGIAFHPNDPNILYIATPIAGVHKSVDRGKTWKAIGDSFPIPFTSAVAVDPTNPNIVYAGLGDHDYGLDQSGWWFGGGYNARQFGGIMRSTDGGNTWSRVLSPVPGCDVNSFATDPDVPGLVLATLAGGDGGVYRSTDFGATWARVATPFNYAEDVEVGRRDSAGKRAYYVVAQGGSLYRSTDQGKTWSPITNFPGGGWLRIATSAVDGNTLYVVGSDTKIRKGVVSGSTWTWSDITGNFPHDYGPGSNSNWWQLPYDYHMEAAAHKIEGTVQDTLYLGLITIAVSPGAKGTWIDLGQTGSSDSRTHNDQHSFAIYPGDPNIMAVGNDGGIYGLTYTPSDSVPGPQAWNFEVRWNNNIGLTAFHMGDFHPTNPNIMLGGTQDNATPASLGNLSRWDNPGAGDGFGCAINPSNPGIQWLTVQGGYVARTEDSWVSGEYNIPPYFSESPGFFTWVGIDPTAPGHFYLGTQFLWRFNETTKSWEGHLGNTQLSGDQVRTIGVAPSNNQRLYVGTTDGLFWVSSDFGATWTQRTGLPSRAYTNIWVHPFNQDIIRVAVGGTGTGHLYESRDAGATFTNISGSGASALPDVPTNAVTADASSIWVGNDLGVFYSRDGGKSWKNATQPFGLPNCEISTLKLVPGTGYLMAATYGRGMWRLPVVFDNNWGQQSGSALVTVNKAALTVTKGIPNIAATLQNTGTGAANSVKITSAKLVLGSDPTKESQSIPLNAGTMNGGDQKVVNLKYAATARPSGTPGTLKLVGTYVRASDNSVQGFTANFSVRIP